MNITNDTESKHDDDEVVSNNMYSFGIRFEYDQENENKTNNEWMVSPKCNDFKDELLNNSICCISKKVYNEEIAKCDEYIQTKYAKSLYNTQVESSSTAVSNNLILVLLIYCNCDQYQYEWSATFRKTPKETDEEVKQRHSHFYYSSLYLRKLVEDFGDDLDRNKLFYHGVNQKLFLIKL